MNGSRRSRILHLAHALAALASGWCTAHPATGWAASATWTAITADMSEVGRAGPSACFDARRGLFVIVGGSRSFICTGANVSITYPSEILTHTLAGDVPWTSNPVSGPFPALDSGAMSADSASDRLWLFGGEHVNNVAPSFPSNYSNTLYGLDLATRSWQACPPAGSPPPRSELGQMVLDAGRGRLLVLGGRDTNGVAVGGVFATSLASPGTWQILSPAGAIPAARWGACAVFDPDSDRVLMCGGLLAAGVKASDVWELRLAGGGTWKQIMTSGPPAIGRCWGALDRTSARLLVFDGRDTTIVRALDLRTRQWSVLPASGTAPDPGEPSIRESSTSAFDPIHRRFIFAWPTDLSTWCHGDNYANTFVLDVPPSATGIAPAPPVSFSLGEAFPDPARGDFRLRLSLPDDGRATVDLFDVAGRIRWSTRVQGTGEHWIALDGRTLGPGCYFVRARFGGASRIRQVLVLR